MFAQDELKSIVTAMKRAHTLAGPASASLRRDRLQRAARLILDNHAAIAEAMNADFGNRSIYQSMIADIATTAKSLLHSAEHVEEWMQAETVEAPGPGMSASIQQQPVGVVGIVSPWNFPINLSFGPLAGVLSAGNTALIKPSELTPKTSELIAELVARYFDPMEVGVVLGDASVGQAFTGLAFDHLVFTGSTSVGRHVMRAAAENLVPVTLELGGKSPVVISEFADVVTAAERTFTVKTFNAGQICLSPDYVLMEESKVATFVDAARAFVSRAFPEIQQNQEYTSIISDRHYQRLVDLIADAEAKGATIVSLAPAGEPVFDPSTRKIAPVIVLNANSTMGVMQEELFGPILPVMIYKQEEDAITYINSQPRPLAAYYFGTDETRQQRFATHTTSGGLVINDVMTHASIETLPFGGIGASGTGSYHGIHGFRRFTHAKPVVIQSEDGASNLRLRAPYADKMADLKAAIKA